MNLQAALRDLSTQCREQGTQERAEFEQGYLKTDMAFFGNTVPQLRKIAKAFQRAHAPWERQQVLDLAVALYAKRNHNLCQLAALIVCGQRQHLLAKDARWIQDLVRRSHTWALVDMLAVEALGDLCERYTSVAKTLPSWTKDKDFWVQRAALLSFIHPFRRGEGDFDTFCKLAAPLLEEKEFFLRKAIGWVLREASKKRPREVFQFLEAQGERVSGLTRREGAKHLDPDLRASLGLS